MLLARMQVGVQVCVRSAQRALHASTRWGRPSSAALPVTSLVQAARPAQCAHQGSYAMARPAGVRSGTAVLPEPWLEMVLHVSNARQVGLARYLMAQACSLALLESTPWGVHHRAPLVLQALLALPLSKQ